MNLTELFLEISFWVLVAAVLVTLVHLYQGPMIMDRVNALNLFGNLIVGLLLIFGFMLGQRLFLEISLIFCLVSFIPIVAMVHYLLKRLGK